MFKTLGLVINESGEPLVYATVSLQNSDVGTTTDVRGRFSLTIPPGATKLEVTYVGYRLERIPISSSDMTIVMKEQASLEELVVVSTPRRSVVNSVSSRSTKSKNKITTTATETPTTVEFEVDEPYTIGSNKGKVTIELFEQNLEAIYQYSAIPKIDRSTYLMARIPNWDQYNLLEGEVNLYFENSFVGRSIIDANSLSDTLDISLGVDKSIVVTRNKVQEYTKKKVIGSSQVQSLGYEITIRNKKSSPIKVLVQDQIPIPAINDIEVEAMQLSGGKVEEDTGLVQWELKIKPQTQESLNLFYKVKHPKKEKVILE